MDRTVSYTNTAILVYVDPSGHQSGKNGKQKIKFLNIFLGVRMGLRCWILMVVLYVSLGGVYLGCVLSLVPTLQYVLACMGFLLVCQFVPDHAKIVRSVALQGQTYIFVKDLSSESATFLLSPVIFGIPCLQYIYIISFFFAFLSWDL